MTHHNGASPRVMFYSHDTYGLGHLRRTLALAHRFVTAMPEITQLVVTGSPVANRFVLPAATDVIKLPSVTKNDAGDYTPWRLATDLSTVTSLREGMLMAAVRHFAPDVVVVDHAPGGLHGEMIAPLQLLKQEFPDTRLVIGLRDILDEAPVVRKTWARDGAYALFDDLYDQILVYGNRTFYDVVGEYGLSERAANRTSFTGYLEREGGRRSRADVRRELDLRTDRLVVVTAGGGKDGWRLYQAMLDDQRRLDCPAYDTLIVGGPLLEREEQRELQARARDLPHVHVLESTTDLPGYLAAADAVVAMGGYNTVCEVLSLQKPTLIVPRTFPRKEQLIRASVLSQRRFVDMLHPADLEQGRLLRATWSLMEERLPRPVLQMDGLGNAARAVSGLLGRPDMATLTGAGA